MNDHPVSPNVAAAVLGISDRHVRRLIADEVLPATGGSRPKISLAALGEFRGHPVSFAEFADAYTLTQRQRDRWAAYQAARRRSGVGDRGRA